MYKKTKAGQSILKSWLETQSVQLVEIVMGAIGVIMLIATFAVLISY
jgi:hypothetical protein